MRPLHPGFGRWSSVAGRVAPLSVASDDRAVTIALGLLRPIQTVLALVVTADALKQFDARQPATTVAREQGR